jgi:hypothetical protein
MSDFAASTSLLTTTTSFFSPAEFFFLDFSFDFSFDPDGRDASTILSRSLFCRCTLHKNIDMLNADRRLLATYPMAVFGVFQPMKAMSDVTLTPLFEAFVPQVLRQQ